MQHCKMQKLVLKTAAKVREPGDGMCLPKAKAPGIGDRVLGSRVLEH